MPQLSPFLTLTYVQHSLAGSLSEVHYWGCQLPATMTLLAPMTLFKYANLSQGNVLPGIYPPSLCSSVDVTATEW